MWRIITFVAVLTGALAGTLAGALPAHATQPADQPYRIDYGSRFVTAVMIDDQGPFTFVIELDRFLPTFVDVEIREIRIVDGGLALQIGAGGASWS